MKNVGIFVGIFLQKSQLARILIPASVFARVPGWEMPVPDREPDDLARTSRKWNQKSGLERRYRGRVLGALSPELRLFAGKWGDTTDTCFG